MYSVFVNYYRKGWYIILTLLILSYMFESWDYLIAFNSCFNLTNLFRGKISNCFASPSIADTCHDLNHGQIYGWCNDTNRYGPQIGNKFGPLKGYCTNWSWQKKTCPPIQCKTSYPVGIGDQNPIQKWGWCMDTGKAMKGERCGPINGVCVNWVWDVNKCSNQPVCPAKLNNTSLNNKIEKGNNVKAMDGHTDEVCSNVCGKIGNETVNCPPKCISKKSSCKNICGLVKGQIIPCPPPNCNKGEDKCMC